MFPYYWKKTEYANPGAENYAFVPNLMLPAFSVGGLGNIALGSYSVLQGAQVISNATIPTAGYGGLVAGQFISQPLAG